MKTRKSIKQAVTLSALALAFATGCGPSGFKVSNLEQNQKAPGTFNIPAKVDIILAEDDTGSMNELLPQVKDQLPKFLNDLGNKGWDYHFATTPLTRFRALNQALASKHDANWGPTEWIPPYPGAVAWAPGTLSTSVFRRPGDYSDFLKADEFSNIDNGIENGFSNISQFLYKGLGSSNFLRSDAMVVFLTITNGEDTSGVNYCTRIDGYTEQCSDGSWETSLNNYKSYFIGLKGRPEMVRFYSAVATAETSCLGGQSFPGTRYQWMAQELGGKSYDVCRTPITQILTDLSTQLKNTQLLMQTRYLFISTEPEESTIKVYKYIGGSASNVVEIPASATNGFTYAGYKENVFAIDYPAPMSRGTGFTIELHGSAKLVGNDTAKVVYKPKGARDAMTN